MNFYFNAGSGLLQFNEHWAFKKKLLNLWQVFIVLKSHFFILDSYWKFKFRDTNLTDETWQVPQNTKIDPEKVKISTKQNIVISNIHLLKLHLTLIGQIVLIRMLQWTTSSSSGAPTSRSSQCLRTSCSSLSTSFLDINYQLGITVILCSRKIQGILLFASKKQ